MSEILKLGIISPVSNAILILQGDGIYRTTTSNAYGYYQFSNISISDGETVSLATSSTSEFQTLIESCELNGGVVCV